MDWWAAMTDMQTWKIQRSLYTNADVDQVLIYNKDRSVEGQMPLTENVLRLFPEGSHKIFVRGVMNKNGSIDIRAVIEDQDW